jgi:hypothetical protein
MANIHCQPSVGITRSPTSEETKSAELVISDRRPGAEADAHDEAQRDQPLHARREGGGERGDAEDRQVELIGEAPAEAIAEYAREDRPDRHADEGRRNEAGVMADIGKPALHHGAEHAAGEIDVETVEEHPGADEPEDAAMERRHRQGIEPGP